MSGWIELKDGYVFQKSGPIWVFNSSVGVFLSEVCAGDEYGTGRGVWDGSHGCFRDSLDHEDDWLCWPISHFMYCEEPLPPNVGAEAE